MAKVLLLCGKICCGKSTYCGKIKGSRAVVLSCDDLMMQLFDEQLGHKHAEVIEKTKNYLRGLSLELLNAGVDVILDWGFWKKQERADTVEFYRAKGVETELHYLKVSDAEWDRRIEKRNRERTPGTYFVDDNMKALFGAAFEEPQADEAPVVIE